MLLQHAVLQCPDSLVAVWPQVQKQTRLHITRDLTEKDVVSRIMRKENYLIGMLNKVGHKSTWLADIGAS